MNSTSSWLAPVLRNKMVLFILAIALLVPLAFTPLSARYPAIGAALLEGCAIVLLSMLLWKADWRNGTGKIIEFFRSAQNIPVLLFLAVAGVSCLLSPQKEYSAQEFLRIGSGIVLFFAVAYHVRRSDQLSCLVDVLLFLCCAISIAGFIQFDSNTGKFASGFFGDHQLYGSCLMALLPIAAAIAVIEKSPSRQLFARASTVLAAAGLLIANSRSAWIGAGVGLSILVIVSIVMMVQKHRAHSGIRVREAVFPVALLVIALSFFLFMWPQTSSILGRASTFGAIKSDASWNSRQTSWDGAVKMVRHSPLFGVGIGLFPFLQHTYAGIGVPVHLHMEPSLSDQAHNLYLQTAAELGIVGLLVFLAVPITLLTLGVRRALKMDEGIRRTLLLGAMAGTVACMVDAFASPSWQTGGVSLFFWLLLGMVATCMAPNSRRERAPVVERPQPATRSVFAFGALGLAVLLPTAAMALVPGYTHIFSCRIDPVLKTIDGGDEVKFRFFGTFKNDVGQTIPEIELTQEPSTTFSLATTGGPGFLEGPNNSVYQSDFHGTYDAFVTATYRDANAMVCTATGKVRVNGRSGDNVKDKYIIYGATGAVLVAWALAHTSDHLPGPNNGNGNPGAYRIVSCSIIPKDRTISKGGKQTFRFLGTFANGAASQVRDITNSPGTRFTYSTSKGQIGSLTGSTYNSSSTNGSYVTTVTATYTDTTGTCTDAATLNVGPPQ